MVHTFGIGILSDHSEQIPGTVPLPVLGVGVRAYFAPEERGQRENTPLPTPAHSWSLSPASRRTSPGRAALPRAQWSRMHLLAGPSLAPSGWRVFDGTASEAILAYVQEGHVAEGICVHTLPPSVER